MVVTLALGRHGGLSFGKLWPWEAMPMVAACRHVVPPSRRGSGRTSYQKHDCDCGRGCGRGGEGGGRGGPAMVMALALGSQGGLSLGKPWLWTVMSVDMVGAVAVAWPWPCLWS